MPPPGPLPQQSQEKLLRDPPVRSWQVFPSGRLSRRWLLPPVACFLASCCRGAAHPLPRTFSLIPVHRLPGVPPFSSGLIELAGQGKCHSGVSATSDLIRTFQSALEYSLKTRTPSSPSLLVMQLGPTSRKGYTLPLRPVIGGISSHTLGPL